MAGEMRHMLNTDKQNTFKGQGWIRTTCLKYLRWILKIHTTKKSLLLLQQTARLSYCIFMLYRPYIYIYIYMCVCMCIYMCVYIYIILCSEYIHVHSFFFNLISYLSRRPAIVSSATVPGKAGFYTLIYDDTPDNTLLAYFTPTGRGACYHNNGVVSFLSTSEGGTLAIETGEISRRWSWPHSGSKLANTIVLNVSRYEWRCVFVHACIWNVAVYWQAFYVQLIESGMIFT